MLRPRRTAAELDLRQRSLLANLKRRRRDLAMNESRAIPTSGPGRRRAKAHRNKTATLSEA